MTMPRYLFPIQTKNGPSFQYQGIKAALKVALLENRTLVTSSFFKYGRFEIDSERLFQETFDVDHLRKLMPVATVTEYKDACKNESITVMWPQDIDFNNTYFKTELEQLRALVKNIFDIVIPDPDETSQGQKTPDDQDKCVMFYINDGIVQNPSPIQSRTITDLSDFHLRRTGFIRDIGSNAMSYICNGHRFAALHWRNRTGEVPEGERLFRDTFDVEQLSQLIDVATIEEFRYACHGSADVVLMWPYTDKRKTKRSFIKYTKVYEYMRVLVKNVTRISLPKVTSIPESKEASLQLYRSSKNFKCVVMYNTNDFLQEELKSEHEAYTMIEIASYLKKSRHIRYAVDRAMTKFCNGGSYAAIHWRNKTGESCRVGLRANREDITCEDHIQLLNDNSATIARAVHDAMKKDGLDCLYLAYPPYSEDILEYMAAEIPKVYTVSDILVHGIPEYMQEDEYYLSLIDQEMASRAALFMASGSSNWSDFVVDERKANGKKNIFIGNLRGIPSSIINML
ncbi:uncharacterized protein LOC102807194 [Saccoglossus kowalevskii]